ncbi:Uncharacterized membrane protein [Jatrophihabitans endophyticus]|uniref:Uncharacterized membrane protein n=1 Tax=Jatrophihabitans endophyticus TaxID=1206085 RepID=A0A1M5R7S0_9ACTN|nr:TMEM175 family protein [Jatrophihabitans endophyticus]SHH22394.1 Uncharacterized membrane protein [Jatrophihabitans endophyticus]
MPDTDSPEQERSRDLDRLLTFVDAIVAIAITLLVLPLAELAGEVHEGDSAWHTIREHGGEFGAFVLSFLVIARIWLAQHRVVRGAIDSDRRFAAGLLAWSLTIVFLPFPTALLADAGSQAVTKVCYIGTLALSSALLALVAVGVRRQLPAGAAARPRVAPAAIDAVIFAVALGLCLLLPVLSYWPLLLLTVADNVDGLQHRYVTRRRRHRVEGQDGSA